MNPYDFFYFCTHKDFWILLSQPQSIRRRKGLTMPCHLVSTDFLLQRTGSQAIAGDVVDRR